MSRILWMLLWLSTTTVLASCSTLGVGSIPVDVLEQRYGSETSQFIDIDQVRIHYRDEGNRSSTAPVLVLVHGVAASLHTWDDWVDELQHRYRLIRFDLPAHGLSDPAELEGHSLAQILDPLMAHLQVDRFSLVGNSLGGYLSWNYALAHPNRVEKLILIDAAGFPQKMPWMMNAASMPFVGELSTLVMPKLLVQHAVKNAYGDDEKISELVVQRYHDLLRNRKNRLGLIATFREMKRYQSRPDLGANVHKLEVPTLLMWGARDPWVPMSIFHQFAAALPEAQKIVYPDVGHMPMEEIPKRSAADADAFLSGP